MNAPRRRSKKGSKKLPELDDDYTVVAIDQTRQELSNLVYAWESLKLLGGVSDEGKSFYIPCEDNFTSDLTVRLLDALQTEFGEKLCVVLDNAPYFAANKVQEFANGTPLELCYLPRGSTSVNPVEECWHRLSQQLGNRLFEKLDELRDAALDSIDRRISSRTCVREYRWVRSYRGVGSPSGGS